MICSLSGNEFSCVFCAGFQNALKMLRICTEYKKKIKTNNAAQWELYSFRNPTSWHSDICANWSVCCATLSCNSHNKSCERDKDRHRDSSTQSWVIANCKNVMWTQEQYYMRSWDSQYKPEILAVLSECPPLLCMHHESSLRTHHVYLFVPSKEKQTALFTQQYIKTNKKWLGIIKLNIINKVYLQSFLVIR